MNPISGSISRGARRGPGRRRRGILLALAALLAQLLVPTWHRPNSASAPDGGSLALVLCTPYGYQVVPLTAPPAAPDQTPGPAPAPRDCALCQALAHAGPLGIPPEAALGPVPAATASEPWRPGVTGPARVAKPRPSAQPRAPPPLLT